MKYVIFGIPGVGKTTVIKQVIEKTGIRHMHWGEMSKDVAIRKGFIKNIDELRQLDIAKQKEVRKEVGQTIFRIAEETEGDILIETHAALKTPRGFFPGFSIKTIENIQPDAFIVIEADPQFILKRRQEDQTRWREEDHTIEDVEESLRVTRNMAMTYAVLAIGTVFFVENKQGEIEYASNKIKELIEQGQLADMRNLGAI